MKLSRKWSALILAGVVSVSMMVSAAAVAEPETVTATLRPDTKIVIDGTERTFYNVKGEEVHPIFYNGSNYLPVRAIGELMGKVVNWDSSTKTVSLGGVRTAAPTVGTPDTTATREAIVVELHPDFSIVVDGVAQRFQDANGALVYPILYEGSNYLPVRAIGELMGKSVRWDAATESVVLSGGNVNGQVTDADSFGPTNPTVPVKPNKPTGTITEAVAKSTALKHAGLAESQVTMQKCYLTWEDGRQVYEVEFYTANQEYDYTIDAVTGAILEWDHDFEDTNPSGGQSGTSSKVIGMDKAKSLALAQVKGAKEKNITKCKLDAEDGVYEIEIRMGRVEYDIELNAYTGALVSKEVDD